MSWTQGVITREDMTDSDVSRLESVYKIRTGEEAKVEYITWFAIDGSDAIAHFDSDRGFRLNPNAWGLSKRAELNAIRLSGSDA